MRQTPVESFPRRVEVIIIAKGGQIWNMFNKHMWVWWWGVHKLLLIQCNIIPEHYANAVLSCRYCNRGWRLWSFSGFRKSKHFAIFSQVLTLQQLSVLHSGENSVTVAPQAQSCKVCVTKVALIAFQNKLKFSLVLFHHMVGLHSFSFISTKDGAQKPIGVSAPSI